MNERLPDVFLGGLALGAHLLKVGGCTDGVERPVSGSRARRNRFTRGSGRD